jgi:hypothetical protein
LMARNITCTLNEAPMSEAKQEMIYLANELMEEVRKWYEAGALPAYIANHFPEAHRFGKFPVYLHQPTFTEAYEKKKGITKLQASESKFLRDYFMEHTRSVDNRTGKETRQSKNYNRLHYIKYGSNAVEESQGKAYVFWPMEQGRMMLEKAVGNPILWRDVEQVTAHTQFNEAETSEADDTNVIEMASRDSKKIL